MLAVASSEIPLKMVSELHVTACLSPCYPEAITPKNLGVFFILNEDGTVKEVNGVPQLRKYDAIKFINKEDSYTCQINNADVMYMNSEYGEMVPYSELEEDEKDDYTDCIMDYALGDKI